jgi:hypothetical protein
MAACFFAGDCGSSESHNTFTSSFSQLSSQTSTFIKTNSLKTAADVMNIQSTNLDVKNMGEKCDINISQSINLKQQVSGSMNAASINDMRTMITTGLQNMATQNTAATAQMGSGALTQSTNSSNDTTLNSEIQNVVNTTCSDSNYNELVSTTLNKQDASIRILNCNGKLTIGQNIVADVIVKNMMDTLATNLQTNTATANVFNQLSQTSSSSSQGLAGLVDSVLGGIKGIFGVGADAAKTIAAIIACIIVVALGAVLYFLLSPAGQAATEKLANAGASKIKGPLG